MRSPSRLRLSPANEHANSSHSLALLRERRERPCGCRTSNYFNELASSHRLRPQGKDYNLPYRSTRAGVVQHGKNWQPMSALGHKQTYAAQQVMSALLPIATTKADICASSCPLYPRKQTCAAQYLMSALGQKRTFRPRRSVDAKPVPEQCIFSERLTLWRGYAARFLNLA